MHALLGRAIIICPRLPEPNPVEILRRRFDPLVEVISAHITLVFPFESKLAPEELQEHIEGALREIGPFPIRLTGVTGVDGCFVFVNVAQGRDALIDMHDRLYTGPLQPHENLAFTFTPHITVGRLPTPEAFEAALAVATASDIDIETSVTSVQVFRANSDGTGAIESVVQLVRDLRDRREAG